MTKEDLDTPSLIIYLKMHAALWAAQHRGKVLADSGLFVDGCPLCGNQEACPRCYRCDEHHDSILDMLGEKEVTGLAIASLITNLCRSNVEEMANAMMALAHPEEAIAAYREPCATRPVGDVNIDEEIWSQFFDEFVDDDDS